MSYQNDKEAYCLARTYNLLPRRHLPYVNTHNYDTGMYEPDHFETAETRCMVLAHIIDHTNVIVQYNPELNFEIPYNVTNGLDPDAAGNYEADSGFNGRPTYVGPDRDFFIWWDGIDSWILNEQIGHTDGPYWKRTDPTIIGEYAPQSGAVGIATVAAGFQIPYIVTGELEPDVTDSYTSKNHFNDKLTYIGIERKFFIWWNGIDSWIINEQIGHTDGPYWKRTDPTIIGEYDPYGGAIGTATVSAGPG